MLFVTLAVILVAVFLLKRFSKNADASIFYYTTYFQAFVLFYLHKLLLPLFRIVFALPPHSIESAAVASAFIEQILNKDASDKKCKVKAVTCENLQGGFIGRTYRVKIEYEDGTHEATDQQFPPSIVVKTVQPTFASHFASMLLGSSRESMFYNDFGTADGAGSHYKLDNLPRIFYASGSYWTGEFITIMEDLNLKQCVQGGHLLGNQCWGNVKLPEHINISHEDVMRIVCLRAGELHAKFWRDKQLLKQYPYMKNIYWLQGKNRASWEFAMQNMQERWRILYEEGIKTNKIQYKWSDKMINLMNTVLKNTSWKNFRRQFDINDPTTPFTLCHGDYHAGNVMWLHGKSMLQHHMYLIDWSEVGVFCPFTDLAQYMISHAPIEMRRQHERKLFQVYYKQLVASDNVDEKVFTLEECWQRYIAGGIERWLQMLLILAFINFRNPKLLPDFGMTYFYNQTEAFVEDYYAECKRLKGLMSIYCMQISK